MIQPQKGPSGIAYMDLKVLKNKHGPACEYAAPRIIGFHGICVKRTTTAKGTVTI